MGPMTGRAAGYCAGHPVPGYMNPVPRMGVGLRGAYPRGVAAYGPVGVGAYPRAYPGYGYGAPYGAPLGRGFGRGLGFRRGFGRGRGRW
jgi:hypothetical protein